MHIDWLIIDGYSLLHRDDEFRTLLSRDLFLAREAALRHVESLIGTLAGRVTVVFDGRSGQAESGNERPGLEVVYSPGHMTADSHIERMVQEAAHPECILVVTSDRLERVTVMAAGAQCMSCGEFLSWSRAGADRLRKRIKRMPGPASHGGTLGDYFPD